VLTTGELTVIGASCGVLALCVLLHYEALRLLTRIMPRFPRPAQPRIVLLLLGVMAAHVTEIWIYALGHLMLDGAPGCGSIQGIEHTGILEYVYYSTVIYTTVGFGDLVPLGPIRFLTAVEALNGLGLIGWSASFTFLEMQRFWKQAED
jgi:hypothetical protein